MVFRITESFMAENLLARTYAQTSGESMTRQTPEERSQCASPHMALCVTPLLQNPGGRS